MEEGTLDRPGERDRLSRGAWFGLEATAVMTLALLLGMLVSWGRLRPFPLVLAVQGLPQAGVFWVGLVAILGHFVYGTLMGMIFAYVARPMTLAKGLGWGALLWLFMEITFVPGIGWMDFGLRRGPGLMFYFLLLHLVYGTTLGLLGARDERAHHVRFDDLGRLAHHNP
jgi:hypothetical protein